MPNIFIAVIGNQDGGFQWEEKLSIPEGVDPATYIREMLEDFNRLETERYGDKAKLRKFISVDTASNTLKGGI